MIVHFSLFTLGIGDYYGCLSFSCSNFLGQILVIKKNYDGKPYCVLNETVKVGETITCPSGAIAKMVSSSYVFLYTHEKVKYPFIMEYGGDDELHGKVCNSQSEVCPVPSTTPKTDFTDSQKTEDYSLYALFVFLPFVIIIVVVIRKRKCTANTAKWKRLMENLIKSIGSDGESGV